METAPEQAAAETTEVEAPEVETPQDPETSSQSQSDPADEQETTEPDTFPRAYVQELRTENAKYRDRAKNADALAQRLHAALVEKTGKLADPTDLPFDAEHLDDAEALTVAIDALLEAKPHLKSRRITGDVGQGATSGNGGGVDLAGLLRSAAG